MMVNDSASYVPISAQVLNEATALITGDAIDPGSTVVDRMFTPNMHVLLDVVKESACAWIRKKASTR